MPLSQTTMVRLLGARMATVARQPSCISSEPSPSSATTWRLRLRDGDAERDRDRQPHAAEHVEILRPLAARPQIEIGVADAADHRFLVLELRDQPLGQFEAVHHLGVVRASGALRIVLARRHDANTLPPVKQRRQDEGDRRLRRHRLLDRAVDDEGKLVVARDGVMLDAERIEHRPHGPAHHAPGRD